MTGIFAFYLIQFTNVPLTMLIPFSGGKYLDIGWLAVAAVVYCGDRHGERCEFYGWPGWSGIQRHGPGGNIFYGCCDRNEKWISSRSPVRLLVRCWDFCCLMYIRPVYLWGIQVLWRWAVLWLADGLYASDADLSCLIVGLIYVVEVLVGYDPGDIF